MYKVNIFLQCLLSSFNSRIAVLSCCRDPPFTCEPIDYHPILFWGLLSIPYPVSSYFWQPINASFYVQTFSNWSFVLSEYFHVLRYNGKSFVTNNSNEKYLYFTYLSPLYIYEGKKKKSLRLYTEKLVIYIFGCLVYPRYMDFRI